MRLLWMTPRPEFGYRGWQAVADGTKRHTLRAKPLKIGAEYMLTTGTRFKKGGADRTGIVVRVTRVQEVGVVEWALGLPFGYISRDDFAFADGFDWREDDSPGDGLGRMMRALYPKGMPERCYLNHFEVVEQPADMRRA